MRLDFQYMLKTLRKLNNSDHKSITETFSLPLTEKDVQHIENWVFLHGCRYLELMSEDDGKCVTITLKSTKKGEDFANDVEVFRMANGLNAFVQ